MKDDRDSMSDVQMDEKVIDRLAQELAEIHDRHVVTDVPSPWDKRSDPAKVAFRDMAIHALNRVPDLLADPEAT